MSVSRSPSLGNIHEYNFDSFHDNTTANSAFKLEVVGQWQ